MPVVSDSSPFSMYYSHTLSIPFLLFYSNLITGHTQRVLFPSETPIFNSDELVSVNVPKRITNVPMQDLKEVTNNPMIPIRAGRAVNPLDLQNQVLAFL